MSHPIAMFDVTSPDPARSLAFYTSMFGWTPGPEFDGYTLVDAGDGIGGGIGPSYGDSDTGVKIYVRVDDLEESLADAERLGGRRLVPPTDLPAGYGSFAVIADPDGFQVGLWRA